MFLISLICFFTQALAQDTSSSDGTLWDFLEPIEELEIEIAEELEKATPELDEKKAAEKAFMLTGTHESLMAFYTDPLTTLDSDKLQLDLINKNDFDIPIVLNDHVIRWMNYFTGPGKRYYRKWLQRSTQFTPMMEKKLAAAGLPKDLIYLSMIESGYKTSAYSRAKAAGLWQFIASTGKANGLRIDWWIDERRDPEKSTKAAIRFLSSLYKRYDNWYLAWASYNAGPGRVNSGIKKTGSRDFWTILRKNGLPNETDNYVPKIIAAAIVGKYRERYGFTNIKYMPSKAYKTEIVGPNISIEILAKCAKMSEKEFLSLNPEIRRWSLPPSPKKQKIKVPAKSNFLAAFRKVPKSKRYSYYRHTVKSGENLGKIASKYKVKVSQIQKLNKIKNPNRIKVGMTLIVPVPGNKQPPPGYSSSAKKRKKYKKKKDKKRSKSSRKKKKRSKKKTHKIKAGETLSNIAQKYKISIADLKKWNNISNANKIRVGKKLQIVKPPKKWKTHSVKRGESLGRIAMKYKCSVSDIKKWNKLKSNKIMVGQKIKIKR